MKLQEHSDGEHSRGKLVGFKVTGLTLHMPLAKPSGNSQRVVSGISHRIFRSSAFQSIRILPSLPILKHSNL